MNPPDLCSPQHDPDAAADLDLVPGIEVEELGAWAFDTFFGDLPTTFADTTDQ